MPRRIPVSHVLTALFACAGVASAQTATVTGLDGQPHEVAQSEFSLTSGEPGCLTAHHHAANGFGFVTALDGVTIPDPDTAGCGYGLLTFSLPVDASEVADGAVGDGLEHDLDESEEADESDAPPPDNVQEVIDAVGENGVTLAVDISDAGVLIDSSDGTAILDASVIVEYDPVPDPDEQAAFRHEIVDGMRLLRTFIEQDSGHFEIFGGADSTYKQRQGETFILDGVSMNGGELNYFLLGMYARFLDYSRVTTHTVLVAGYNGLITAGNAVGLFDYAGQGMTGSDGQHAAASRGWHIMDEAMDWAEEHTTEEAIEEYTRIMGEEPPEDLLQDPDYYIAPEVTFRVIVGALVQEVDIHHQ